MNKTSLVALMAEELSISKTLAARIYEAMIKGITDGLRNGEQVKLTDFGTFEVRPRVARTAYHPQTNEKIEVPAKKVVCFRPSQALKNAVN